MRLNDFWNCSHKKNIYGGFAGMISAPVIYRVFNPFDLPTVCVLSVFGFGLGLLWGIFPGTLFMEKNTMSKTIKHM